MIFLICQHCRRPSAAEAKFCSECGTALPRQACPACQATNDIDAAQCHACGVTLAAAVVAEAAAEATGSEASLESHAATADPAGPEVASDEPVVLEREPAASEEAVPVAGSDVETDVAGAAPGGPEDRAAPAPEVNTETATETEHPTTAEAMPAMEAPPAADASPPDSPGDDAAAVVVAVANADAGLGDAGAANDPAVPQAVAALRAAVMPLQQLAERGDLRPTLTMVPPQDPPAPAPPPPPVLDTQIVVPAPASLEPAAGDEPPAGFRGAAWPDEPPRQRRREWAGPFFVGLGAVAVVTFAAMAFVGWSSSKPAVQASKASQQPSLAGSVKPSSPAVDAAADAAAEAAARLLATTPERTARKPDGRALETVVSTTSPVTPARPAREAPPPRPPIAVAQVRAPAAATAAPMISLPAATRLPAGPAANAGPGTPLPLPAEAVRARAAPPTTPTVLPRECTAAMDALGLCQTGSKPSGS